MLFITLRIDKLIILRFVSLQPLVIAMGEILRGLDAICCTVRRFKVFATVSNIGLQDAELRFRPNLVVHIRDC